MSSKWSIVSSKYHLLPTAHLYGEASERRQRDVGEPSGVVMQESEVEAHLKGVYGGVPGCKGCKGV